MYPMSCAFRFGLKSPVRYRNSVGMVAATKSLSVSVRQLFEKESSTYTYLVIDKSSKSAVLIDPVIDTAERYAFLICE